MTFNKSAAIVLAALSAALAPAARASAADISARLSGGAPQTMFRSGVDGCAPIDTPDINARAFRDADGGVSMFALHYVNRALRGPDLSHLKIDCKVALDSGLDSHPADYNDRRYMTATWTDDGRRIVGIVHHEYHAEDHGRCSFKETIKCWFNSILSFQSADGGHSFQMDKPAVVASAPFGQDVGQGRHRGFFNPSNIVSDGRYEYFMSSTTGWDGQNHGVCLFRSANPFDSASWRAFDGADFTIHYRDPYAADRQATKPCAIIGPFGLPVGSITRHKASGRWLAVWLASKNNDLIPLDGFYYATSTDLRQWSEPRLLLAGHAFQEGACGGRIISYPAVLDEGSTSRNFDETGDAPWLYYVNIKMNGCETGERAIVRERLAISPLVERASQ